MHSVIAGVGLAPGEIKINLGEFCPSSQGGFQLRLTLDRGTICSVEPRIGFMHRGAEKLFEVRDYRQIMMLANRHDWCAPFTSELGVAITLETAMGIHPHLGADYIPANNTNPASSKSHYQPLRVDYGKPSTPNVCADWQR